MSAEARIAAVVLAAGASKRLGRAKQTVMLSGEMLVERAVRVAREAGLRPVIVVVREGNEFAARVEELGGIVMVNEEAEEGMAASIRCGVKAAVGWESAGVVVMTCDQVGLRAEHLRKLTEVPGRVTGSRYGGRVGIPAYFPAESFGELMELKGDVGARELLREACAVVEEALAVDVDTEEDLVRARAALGS